MAFEGVMYMSLSLNRYDGLDQNNNGIITKVSRVSRFVGTGKKEKYVFDIFEKNKCFHGFGFELADKNKVKFYSIEIK